MRRFSQFLLAHNRNAILVALIAALLPLLNLPGAFLSAIIVGFVTLRKGTKAGAIILAWVALPALALFYLKQFGIFDIILLRSILVWLMAVILRRYQSWRLALEIVTLIAVLLIFTVHLFIPDVKSFWLQYINSYIKEISKAAAWKLSTNETQEIIQRIIPIASGVYAFIILLGAFVQLFLARWWESYLYAPGKIRQEFIRIRMGYTLAVLLFLILLGMLVRIPITFDIFPVLLAPFLIAGLSLLHFYYTTYKSLLIVLILIYMSLLFLPFIAVLLIAFLGYIDTWIHIRRLKPAIPKNQK